jgi:hypothetical protein
VSDFAERPAEPDLIEQAIQHYEYGITHDVFSEPVTSYFCGRGDITSALGERLSAWELRVWKGQKN